ncbi:MAG: cell division protein FtsB, partial [Archaeoglobus sp.]
DESEEKKESVAIPIGIKIGSQHTVIVTENNTFVTHTCIKETENPITGEKDYVVGDEALELFGDEVNYMLRGGFPGTEEEAELFKIYLVKLINEYGLPENSYVTYAVPSIESEVCVNLIKKVIAQLPIGWIGKEMWNDSFLGALAFEDGMNMVNRTFLVINLGSSTTEVVAVRKGGIVYSLVTGAVSGDIVDRKIRNEIQNETRGAVNIDLNTAREFKERYANLKNWEKVQETVHLFEKGRYSFRVDECIIRPVNEYVEEVADLIALQFLPELAERNFSIYRQIIKKDFILLGGMAEIPGLAEKLEALLRDRLDVAVRVKMPENPSTASARGAYTISKFRIEKKS